MLENVVTLTIFIPLKKQNPIRYTWLYNIKVLILVLLIVVFLTEKGNSYAGLRRYPYTGITGSTLEIVQLYW